VSYVHRAGILELMGAVNSHLQVRYKFESALCNTTVLCEYSKGEAVFRSSNFSVLNTIRDAISREATQIKVKLETNAI
jgi:hypothetical protein